MADVLPPPARHHMSIWLACVIVFLGALAWQHGAVDRAALLALNQAGPQAPQWWSSLSVLGLGLSAMLLVGAAGPAGARTLAAVLLLVIGGGLLVQALKWALLSGRPAAVLGAHALAIIGNPLHGRGMPSGHAALAAALACWLASHQTLPRWLGGAAVLLAVLVAGSRVVVGAHWPSDVIAGAALGVAIAVGLTATHAPLRLGQVLRRPAPAGVVALGLLAAGLSLLFMDTGYPQARAAQGTIACLGLAGAWRWWPYQARRAFAWRWGTR